MKLRTRIVSLGEIMAHPNHSLAAEDYVPKEAQMAKTEKPNVSAIN